MRDGNIDGEYVAYLRPAQFAEIIDLIFRDPRIINEGATIEVPNGSDVEGLASFEKAALSTAVFLSPGLLTSATPLMTSTGRTR